MVTIPDIPGFYASRCLDFFYQQYQYECSKNHGISSHWLGGFGDPNSLGPRYESADSNRVGDLTSLQKTRQRLEKILQEEAARVGEDKVFLGGLSQGCTAALDIYVTTSLQLGGFVGSVGFVPSDDMGFVGADDALEKLMQDQVKRERPVHFTSCGAMAKRSKLTKKKSEKAWTNGKRKFKAHDPVYRNLDVRQQMAHHAKKKERCMAPKGDRPRPF
eukprot:symbB.v1.2.029571.t1/scaffold3255.1/size60169/1